MSTNQTIILILFLTDAVLDKSERWISLTICVLSLLISYGGEEYRYLLVLQVLLILIVAFKAVKEAIRVWHENR